MNKTRWRESRDEIPDANTIADRGWHTSTHSGMQGNCVEVSADGGEISVRDTKNRRAATLIFAPETWNTFVTTLKNQD